MFPSADEFHRQPDAEDYGRFSDEFGGIDDFPFKSTELNLLSVHQDLVDLAKNLLGTEHLRVYSIEAWAKYTGAADFDQYHHRDYLSQTMVVPSHDSRFQQVEMFLYLSDVPVDLGPPSFVARRYTQDLPAIPNWLPRTTMRALTKNTQNGSLSRADQVSMNMKYRLPDRWELLWPMPMTRSIEARLSGSEALVTRFM